MTGRLRLIPRIALFSALIYVISWGTSYLPNINLMFFIVFIAGFFWGAIPGMLVGALGMGLWTTFNPFGPASPPVMMAQVSGMALSGAIGALFRLRRWHEHRGRRQIGYLILAASVCTLLFYLIVNLTDAWVFQPFWPRFIAGMAWSLISLVSNAVVFPVLFGPVTALYNRKRFA